MRFQCCVSLKHYLSLLVLYLSLSLPLTSSLVYSSTSAIIAVSKHQQISDPSRWHVLRSLLRSKYQSIHRLADSHLQTRFNWRNWSALPHQTLKARSHRLVTVKRRIRQWRWCHRSPIYFHYFQPFYRVFPLPPRWCFFASSSRKVRFSFVPPSPFISSYFQRTPYPPSSPLAATKVFPSQNTILSLAECCRTVLADT